ncbi:MAG TPA: hypothetical protein VJ854_06795 [Sphaerochaeta sp.]|nr:hypothetical protein [Sphaerochaeta sp.]
MAKSNKKIESTKAPAPPKKAEKPLSPKGEELLDDLNDLTIEQLTRAFHSLAGKDPVGKQKYEVCKQVARLLDFDDQQGFDLFFASLPPYLQELIQRAAFEQIVDIRSLKTSVEEPLVVKESMWYTYHSSLRPNPALRVGLFAALSEHELQIYPAFAAYFPSWLPKPALYTLQPLSAIEGTPWSVNLEISSVMPLLVEAAAEMMKSKFEDDVIRKGLLKRDIKNLRASCALEPFAVASSYGLDPIELFVQALVHLKEKALTRPADGESFVKELVKRFFFDPKLTSKDMNGVELEYYTLLGQFSKSAYAYSVEFKYQVRKSLKDLLLQMYGGGEWFSVENLFQSFVMHGNEFELWNSDILDRVLFLRGDAIETELGSYTPSPYDKGFRAQGTLKRMLFEKPLFKAYCYLFAVLGLVEIGEKPAPLVLSKNGKMHPLTPYEGICSMKLTPFGAWCLDFTDERPQARKEEFETIADTNLLLVTFKGLSLERRLFLEQIGDAMGSERYKISEASFIRGCTDPSDIQTRIERFKSLIEPDPSERWLSFFSMVEKKATLFAYGQPVLLYTFPDDSAIRKMFALDPAFRKIIIRAEGNRIVIQEKDQALFRKLLAGQGYLNTL